jgi:hypothetical protein
MELTETTLKMHLFLSEFECDLVLVHFCYLTLPFAIQNREVMLKETSNSLSNSFHLRKSYVILACGTSREIQL